MAQMQHYVPQFLLRAFGTGKRDRLHVFDKQTGKTFQASVRKLATEGGFYDFEFQGVPATLETSLSELESKAAELLSPVVRDASLTSLDLDGLAVLSSFLAVQLTRTRAAREMQSDISRHLADTLRRHAGDDPERLRQVNEYIGSPADANTQVMEHAGLISHASEHFAPLLLDKAWWLGRTTDHNPLLIGDHPVVLQNQFGPGSTLGLSALGIEIYFPLSPSLILAIYDPPLMNRMKQVIKDKGVEADTRLVALLAAMDTGTAVELDPANVENMNSLQIAFAERFVFSSSGDFRLAVDMIRTDPNIVSGPRFTSM